MNTNIINRIPARISSWAQKHVEKQQPESESVAEEILLQKHGIPFKVRRVDECSPQIVNFADTYGQTRNLAPYTTSRAKAEKRFGKGMYNTISQISRVMGDFPVTMPTTCFEAKVVGVIAPAPEFAKEEPERAMPLYAQGPDHGRLRAGRCDVVFCL